MARSACGRSKEMEGMLYVVVKIDGSSYEPASSLSVAGRRCAELVLYALLSAHV